MHTLLTRLFEKRGIKDANDLSEEEKVWFDSRQAILSKEKLEIEDIKNFCLNQLSVIESKWSDYNIDKDKKAELLPYYTVYKALVRAFDSPQQARQALEQELNQLLKG